MAEDANIMVGLKVSCVYVDEYAMMVQNDIVIHHKCLFLAIKPCPMWLIFSMVFRFHTMSHLWT